MISGLLFFVVSCGETLSVSPVQRVFSSCTETYRPSPSHTQRYKNQLALLQGGDLDKIATDLALLRVDQEYLRGELVPRLKKNEVGLRTRIE